MHDDAMTRRDYIRYGGAVAGGGLLAGCTDDSGPAASETATATETETPTNDSYSVTMEPVGTVEFESVPET
jgi:iron complex transport system substrate-binding protein